MRTVRLAKVAAQAEVLRVREMARRQVRRAILGMVASFFLIAFLVAGHIAIGVSLVPTVTPLQAVMIVGGGDLVIALILLLLVIFSKPGTVEREAAEMGKRMRQELRESVTLPMALGGAARLVGLQNVIKLAMSLATGRAFRRRRA